MAGALSLLIVATLETMVGLPPSPGTPIPISSVPRPTSSILNILISAFLAFTAPDSVDLLGSIPVGVKLIAQGRGRLII